MSKPAVGKGPWPQSINSRVTRYLNARRDQQRLTLTCGIDGCQFEFCGPYAEVLEQRAEHRKVLHAEWKGPKRRRLRL